MRYCRARRLIEHHVRAGILGFNPCDAIAALSSYSLLWHNGVYSLTFWLGDHLESREHPCCYRVLVAAGSIAMSRMCSVQRKLGDSVGVRTLGTFMKKKIVNTHAIDWTRPRYPTVLTSGFEYDPFEGEIEKWVADHNIDVSGFINSRHVRDEGLRTEALTMLTEHVDPPMRTDEVDDIVKATLVLWATTPDLHEVIPEMTEELLMNIPISKSASGAVAVSLPGIVAGSKELMVSAAAVCFSELGLLPYEAYPKAEVIKVGKKVRQITVEPFTLYLKSSYFFQHFVRIHGATALGNCTGLSRARTVGLLQSMYQDEKSFDPHMSWGDFLDLLESVGLCEDDKVCWEKTTNRFGGIIAALYSCSQVTISANDVAHMAQVIAHDLCPFIKFNGHDSYAAPYKTASGKFKTLHDNTIKHLAGVCAVQVHLWEHHTAPGAACCGGLVVTEREISRIVGGGKVGDDSIRISCHDELVAKLTDHYLGSQTITESGKAFGTPGIPAAEFLRVRFRRRGEVITTYRERDRVFAKLVLGDARANKANFKAALASASLELGDDPQGNAMLHELYARLDWEGAEDIEFSADLISRGEGLEEGDPCEPFTYEEVILKQNGSVDVVDEINSYY